jgi:integrase
VTRDVLPSLRGAMRRTRQRGGIDELRSRALRVRVYTGTDPISKRRMYLTEVVPAGPKAGDEAEKVRARLLHQVDPET